MDSNLCRLLNKQSEAYSPCRICLELDQSQTNIFSAGLKASEPDLATQLEYCAGVAVRKDDGLPHGICADCLRELGQAYHFVRKCQRSERRLLRLAAADPSPTDLDEQTLKFESDHVPDHANSSIAWTEEENYYKLEIEKEVNAKFIKKKTRRSEGEATRGDGRRRRHVCDLCGATSASRAALAVHARTHSGERPFVCHHCGAGFAQKSTLQTHLARRHSSVKLATEKRYACDACGKRYTTSTNLKVHVRTHTHERPYACTLCPARFTQTGPLQAHTRRHSGLRPHACATCGKRFTDRTHLLRHHSVHSDARPFQCSLCPVALKSRYSLKVHLARHSGVRAHVCDACGAAFSTVWSLTAHARNRHSERSGLCGTCDKPVSNLLEHASLHSGEKRFACGACGARFASRRGLAVHARRHSVACTPLRRRRCYPTLAEPIQKV